MMSNYFINEVTWALLEKGLYKNGEHNSHKPFSTKSFAALPDPDALSLCPLMISVSSAPQIRCRSSYRGAARKVIHTVTHCYTLLHVSLKCAYCSQDCFATFPAYPYQLGGPSKFSTIDDIDSVWFGRPVLMFSSYIFRPLGCAKESFNCNLMSAHFSAWNLLKNLKVLCNPNEASECCTNLVRGTLQSGPPKSLFFTWDTLNMYPARLL